MKILVVEDEPINRDLISQIIKIEGHECIEASSAELALQLAKKIIPDLIFMDIKLPGMNGLEATKRLKSDPVTRSIPVVAISAYALEEDRKKALNAGCEGYITKPFKYKEIVDAINKIKQKRNHGKG